MVDKLEAVYEERECLAPDAYDIGLMKNGGMPGCPCCGKTAVTFSRFFPHLGIYQAYVHCAHCDMQVFKNARDHDEARQLAKDAWSKRPDHTPANGEQVELIAEVLMLYDLDYDGNWPMDKVRGALAYRDSEHSGDCTKQPWTCMRCACDEVYKVAHAVAATLFTALGNKETDRHG